MGAWGLGIIIRKALNYPRFTLVTIGIICNLLPSQLQDTFVYDLTYLIDWSGATGLTTTVPGEDEFKQRKVGGKMG